MKNPEMQQHLLVISEHFIFSSFFPHISFSGSQTLSYALSIKVESNKEAEQ